jgi:hypothetical protein
MAIDANTATLSRARRLGLGGVAGNARLTSLAGAVLIVLLAVEGATIPMIRSLLSVHVFVGMLLLGPVGLKLGATAYRFARYYTGSRTYVRQGPPTPLMRVVVAPVLVLSTLTLFATGVLLVASPGRGAVLGLHKASFLVWFGATSIHVLAYAVRAGKWASADLGGGRIGGEWLRLAALVVALAAGIAIAVVTFPLAAPWLHGALRSPG